MQGVVHLDIDKEIQPVIQPPRRVPLSVKPKLKEELNRLLQDDVIIKVDESRGWVSALTTVMKPSGKLRLCIDPNR